MKYLIFTILVVSSIFAKESDFSIIINKPFNEVLFDVTEDYDRSISAVGFSRDFKVNHKYNQPFTSPFDYLSAISDAKGSQMHLIKIGKNGDLILDKASNLSKFNEAIAVVKTPNNGYFVGGYTLDGSLLILKLNSHGDLMFNREFGTNNYDRMNNLILLSDGGVLAIGSSVTSRSQHDNIFETGLGLNDIYLTRFSKTGDRLWSKKYGTIYDDRGIDAVEARDGSIIVVSTTSYDKSKNITLMRINENGDKIWLKHYKNDNEIITPYKIIRLKDNNFLLSLTHVNNMNKEQIRLIKFDIQKNILIDKELHTAYSSAIKDIKEYSDSKLIGVGYVRDTFNTDALVMMLDSSLDLLFQEHFGAQNYDEFNAVTILHNSQAVAVGINTDENSQESNMWVIKLNQDATMAQKITKTTKFYDKLCEVFANEIFHNQLLIKEDLSIEFIAPELFFRVAEYELSAKQKEFLALFSKKLLSFLKSTSANIETLEVNGHTSSEWREADFTQNYLKNEKLSMQRAYATLHYIFQMQDISIKMWLKDILKGSGLSYSKSFETPDKESSRRVSFRIVLRR